MGVMYMVGIFDHLITTKEMHTITDTILDTVHGLASAMVCISFVVKCVELLEWLQGIPTGDVRYTRRISVVKTCSNHLVKGTRFADCMCFPDLVSAVCIVVERLRYGGDVNV